MFYLITKPDCIWCDRAKELLDSKDECYEAHFFTEHPMIVKLMFEANLKSVPQIWKDSVYIGGYEDLVDWYKDDT